MRFLLAAFLLVGACSGDTPSQIDANPAGPKCTMQLFDLCTEEHDCNGPSGMPPGVCQNFATQGFQVCTQGCTAMAPCPNDKSGAPASCESGICLPAEPNHCHL